MSFAKNLSLNGKNVVFHSFNQDDNTSDFCHQMNIPFFKMSLKKSILLYMVEKLGSKIIASWIMKTPFFLSIFNMIPSLANMILLGHIVDKLIKDPGLIIVLDSPSSGHAASLFESSFNFKEMFKRGKIVDDINRMHDFINKKNLVKVIICSIPTIMAIHEGMEMRTFFKNVNKLNTEIVFNNSLTSMPDLIKKKLPKFLEKKIAMEQEVHKLFETEIAAIIPHVAKTDQEDVVKSLIPYMEKLI